LIFVVRGGAPGVRPTRLQLGADGTHNTLECELPRFVRTPHTMSPEAP
jgi:hypothetical protein